MHYLGQNFVLMIKEAHKQAYLNDSPLHADMAAALESPANQPINSPDQHCDRIDLTLVEAVFDALTERGHSISALREQLKMTGVAANFTSRALYILTAPTFFDCARVAMHLASTDNNVFTANVVEKNDVVAINVHFHVETSQLVKEHIKAQETAQKAKNNYELKNEKLGSKMKIQQDLIEKNNKLISLGKKLQHSIDQFKVRTRKKDANKIVIDDLIKYINLEKNRIESLKMAEKAKKIELKKTSFKPKQNKNKSIKDEYQRNKIIVGSTVKLIATKQTGTVEEIKGNNITVTFGFLKMKVSIDKLMFIK